MVPATVSSAKHSAVCCTHTRIPAHSGASAQTRRAVVPLVGVHAVETRATANRTTRPNKISALRGLVACPALRSSRGRRDSQIVQALRNVDWPQALLLDMDGTIVDTEPDGHRVSFNKAFAAKGAVRLEQHP